MMLTKDIELGIKLLKFCNSKVPKSVFEFSEKTKLSYDFTEQVARKLRISGLLIVKRGPNGGYKRIKRKVSVFEIYKAIKPNKIKSDDLITKSIIKALKKINV